MNATATFQTDNARRHLTTLCEHFSRRVPTEQTGLTGCVEFAFGRCQMSADETCLILKASASGTKELDEVVEVVTRHLERFAFRENPHLDWQPDPDTSTDIGTDISPESHSPRKDKT